MPKQKKQLTRAELRLVKTALTYYDNGDPIKDAFDTGGQEQDTIISCMRVAAFVSEE